jgi:hypothetical protein
VPEATEPIALSKAAVPCSKIGVMEVEAPEMMVLLPTDNDVIMGLGVALTRYGVPTIWPIATKLFAKKNILNMILINNFMDRY